MIKKLAWIALILLTVVVVSYWRTISYGVRQAKGQLTIIFNTQPVAEVLSDSLVADSIKYKIRIIQEARSFAMNELGLTRNENYTTFYDQKGEVVLWNLSASETFELKPKLWYFPFLGSFPYKGFFDPELAKAEMKKLKDEGYDVRVRSVGGWSTLGWTKDPILSNMLEKAEGSLAELIIHELTHGTLFVKDNIAFNENLATFIGERGAVLFLNQKYGKNSDAYFEYLLAEEDSHTFREQMLLGTKKLDSLYNSFQNAPDSIKAFQKHLMIDRIISSVDTLHFHNNRYYRVFKKGRPNNAYFMSYLRYYSAKDSLQEILSSEYQNNLPEFILGMKDFHQ